MTQQDAGRVVIVTGASSGIGAATARCLAHAGVTVVLCARRIELLEEIRMTLPNAATHRCLAVDVTDPAAISDAITTTVAQYQRLDAVICNAGIGMTAPIAEMDYHQFQQVLAVNVGGFLHIVRATNPVFKISGSGHYIVISSVVGQHALPYNGGYAASKAALERLCEALRIELRGSGIGLTVIRPGTVATEFFEHRIGPDGERRIAKSNGMSPNVVAQSVLYALERRPRVIYPRLRDRLMSICADIFPSLTDVILARSITWQQKTGVDEMSTPVDSD
jgi:NADP-dependent 3-hydroxy acid dehydrogenase YdfG